MNCQAVQIESAADTFFPATVLAKRFAWHLKRDGVLATAGKILRKLARQHPTRDDPAKRKSAEQSLDLTSGEWVRVRPIEEIRETLDSGGRCRGLFFMPAMEAHCGSSFRVHKRVEQIILETNGHLRKMKNTVLLDGAICAGTGVRCDRSCMYFWREAWLERIGKS